MKTTIIQCDLIDAEDHSIDIKTHKLDIIYLPSETRGEFSSTKIKQQDLDICTKCMSRILENKKYITTISSYNENLFYLYEHTWREYTDFNKGNAEYKIDHKYSLHK